MDRGKKISKGFRERDYGVGEKLGSAFESLKKMLSSDEEEKKKKKKKKGKIVDQNKAKAFMKGFRGE